MYHLLNVNLEVKGWLVMTVVVLVFDWRPTPVWAGTRQVSMLARALYEYLAVFLLGTVV